MGEDAMKNHTPIPSDLTFELLITANQFRSDGEERIALSLYIEALAQLGESTELLSAIADCHFSLGIGNPDETGENYEQAIYWMERAIALAPSISRLHSHLAQYYAVGILDYERAAEAYRAAIRLNPHDARTLFSAASIYDVPDQVVTLEEAIQWLERAARLEPDDPMFHARLGEFYYKAGRFLETAHEWRRALLCPQPLDSSYVHLIKEVTGMLSSAF